MLSCLTNYKCDSNHVIVQIANNEMWHIFENNSAHCVLLIVKHIGHFSVRVTALLSFYIGVTRSKILPEFLKTSCAHILFAIIRQNMPAIDKTHRLHWCPAHDLSSFVGIPFPRHLNDFSSFREHCLYTLEGAFRDNFFCPLFVCTFPIG